jgi:flavin reductase (DIM6/NTAB) family NADH-FMN oxidoreductase RutF
MQIVASYDLAKERRFPEQIAIAVAKDPAGKYNPITLSWVMPTSIDPPMMAIAVGKERHSAAALRHARSFVLSLPSDRMKSDVLFHGTKSGRNMDKLAECGTKTQPATKIDSVLLADAVANYECELVYEHAAGDHIIFVGRVVASHVNQDPAARRIYTLGNERMGAVRAVEEG